MRYGTGKKGSEESHEGHGVNVRAVAVANRIACCALFVRVGVIGVGVGVVLCSFVSVLSFVSALFSVHVKVEVHYFLHYDNISSE
jgi:O-antigen/teichoic acid export membrane protein